MREFVNEIIEESLNDRVATLELKRKNSPLGSISTESSSMSIHLYIYSASLQSKVAPFSLSFRNHPS